MAATTLARRAEEPPVLARLKTDPAFQAFWMMRIGFTVVPILFGADKFAHVMVNWDKYLAPEVQHWFSPFDTVHQTMYVVGIVEIVAGVVVLLLPRVGGYWDVMMRDVALCLLALSFARLSSSADVVRPAQPSSPSSTSTG